MVAPNKTWMARLVTDTLAPGYILGCVGLLLAVHGPRELTALVTAVLTGLAAGAIITTGWKVSGHTGIAGATTPPPRRQQACSLVFSPSAPSSCHFANEQLSGQRRS